MTSEKVNLNSPKIRLPDSWILRPATEQDQIAILGLVLKNWLDPTQFRMCREKIG